jgi:hypothetical protein
MVDNFILEAPTTRQFSRLALSIIGRTLQSLVEAMPCNQGHTKLWCYHSIVHLEGLGTGAKTYFTKTTMDKPGCEGHLWWHHCLSQGKSRSTRLWSSATRIPMWGNVSHPIWPAPHVERQRTQIVYKFSSNWKELMTLKLSLLHIKKEIFYQQYVCVLDILQVIHVPGHDMVDYGLDVITDVETSISFNLDGIGF